MRAVGWGVFRLEDEYRERLNRLAPRQYSAARTGNLDRARRLCERLVDDGRAVRTGRGRYVFALPEDAAESGWYDEYVLKLAVSTDAADGRGRERNRAEAATWERTESSYLVPVVAADPEGYWLVAPKGEPVTDSAAGLDRWLAEADDRLGDEIRRGALDGADHVVRLDGSYRLCDYGAVTATA
jgi:hypothetical protein